MTLRKLLALYGLTIDDRFEVSADDRGDRVILTLTWRRRK